MRDAIELGNTRVYPAELERALHRAPGIADAAAVALQGDLVIAVVATRGSAQEAGEVLHRLRDRMPADVTPVVRWVEAIPGNAAHKILRDQLRESLTRR